MKKQLFTALVASTLVASTLLSQAAFATQTIKANVNGMVCAFCAQGIEKKCVPFHKPKTFTLI